ncbi:unnamed protein product [Phaedon cochleariae]|uniref:AB hydrolase-1 domain-containing protein n=1 Tax=Phaedon cochleariae TaxID=80249 RepID=A0A9P0DVY6_PHACE|nr:unnamed protein product [Phaedon cochleariae]
MEAKTKIDEFNIPVPWGHIAVKAWGDSNDPHVLVVHGRLDNAGGFDNLMHLLPNCFYYVCMDLPGHGKSSHFPAHLPLQTLDQVIAYKLAIAHFDKKFIILGHSYGAQLALLFTRLYPNLVEKIILLDAFHLYTKEVKDLKKYLIKKLESFLDIDAKLATRQPPTYTYEEARERISGNRYQGETLLTKAADPLLARMLKSADNGKYTFTFDQRMKSYINPLHDRRFAKESLLEDPVTCPVLLILAKQNQKPIRKYADILDMIRKWKNVTVRFVEGGHDVHNNYPERVAPHITEFLLKQEAKL